MNIKGEYIITVNEYRECTFYTMNRLNRGWRFLSNGYFIVSILYFALIYAGKLNADPITVFLLVACGLFLLSRFFIINNRILTYAKRPDSMIGAIHYLVINEDQIYISVPKLRLRGEGFFNQIFKVFEITAEFIIYTDSKTCFILPKRVLKDENVTLLRNKFVNALGDHFESKYIHKSIRSIYRSLFSTLKKNLADFKR